MLVSFKSDKYNACHVKKKGVGFFFSSRCLYFVETLFCQL